MAARYHPKSETEASRTARCRAVEVVIDIDRTQSRQATV
jgi:hypothetical protein